MYHRFPARCSVRRLLLLSLTSVALALGFGVLPPFTLSANHPAPPTPMTTAWVEANTACTPGTPLGNNNAFVAGTNGPVAIWANADQDPKELTLDISGSHNVIDGLVVS